MTHAAPLRVFAEAFFTHFGAALTPRADELIVDLPPRLADHFGKPRLYLIFPAEQKQGRDLSPHEDLLVYGSRIFEAMLALLAGQGEVARLQLPRQVTVDIQAMPAPSLRRPSMQVAELDKTSGQAWYYLFNFRVGYVSDEKEEAFLTVAIDEQGESAPTLLDFLQQTPPLPTAPESAPALSTTMAEQAAAEARTLASRRAAELTRTGRVRLEKTLLRLTGYYQRRLDEVDTGDAAGDESVRAELQRDLEQKIADEMMRHQVQVTITPVSHAAVLLPTVHCRVAVAAGAAGEGLACQPGPESGPPVTPPDGVDWAGFRWQWAGRPDYEVWVGHHFQRGVLVAVLDKPGRLLAWQQAGWRGRLSQLLFSSE